VTCWPSPSCSPWPTPPARAWEPRTIRLQLMAIPAVIARRTVLRYKACHPWTSLLLDGLGHLQALPAP